MEKESKKTQREKKRKRKKHPRQRSETVRVAMIIGLLLCASVTYQIYKVQQKYQAEYVPQLEEAQARVEAQEEKKQELERVELYMDTQQYIEEIAREKLGLIYPDEIILKRADE